MEFDWDPEKAAENLRKHKLDFDTATRVFLDPYYVEYDQEDDDDGHAIMPLASSMAECCM